MVLYKYPLLSCGWRIAELQKTHAVGFMEFVGWLIGRMWNSLACEACENHDLKSVSILKAQNIMQYHSH